MPSQELDEREIFTAARRLVSPEARAEYLQQVCGADRDFLERITALLRECEGSESFLEAPAATDPTLNSPVAEKPGETIGRYKLIEQIGEGGMGVVFMALQAEPVKRAVAVKIIKPGMDSKAVLARFAAERQALAMMDHPNIARVLDAGSTDAGRPFFVMELVKGTPITQYCDQQRLTPRERLELFLPVCQAIQHAHQKGIIHRDIKPSNVLVALYDDKPVPKVIDFGVAKATGQALTEKTLLTGFGALVGTPEYMSPEQAELNNLDIDTRSDVYSLGVLLYELLIGSTPLDRKSLGEAALLEVLRIVREVEAPRPSAKLSSSDALPSIAANRNLEPARLTKLVEGELDWVLLKALEKDRTRRYETANDLARDIERYLADEVVEARPPTSGYRLRKFVRRHKGQVIAASMVLLALLTGIGGTTFGLVRAERQRRIAQQQQERAEAGERLAGERLIQVEAEKQVAQAVRDFLQNKLLGQADTRNQANALLKAGGSSSETKLNPTIRELLDRAALELAPDKIEANFPRQPLLQAELLKTVGDTYRGIGEYQRAIEFLTRAAELRKTHFGADHADTLHTLDSLANAYWEAGNRPQAIELFEHLRDARLKKLGANHLDTLTTLTNLANASKEAGGLHEAIELFEQARDAQVKRLGADTPDTLSTLNNLARANQSVGKPRQGMELFNQARDALVNKLGADDPGTIHALNNLAWAYLRNEKAPQAIELLERVRDAEIKKLGADHPDTLKTLDNLALAYERAGKLPEAIELYEQVRDALVKKLGADHPDTLTTLSELAFAYEAAGKWPQALRFFEQAASGIEKRNYLHQYARLVIAYTALAYEAAKQFDKAEAWRRKWLAAVKQKSGARSPEYARGLAGLGLYLLRQKKYRDAEPILRGCLDVREKLLKKNQVTAAELANVKSVLGEALLGQNRPAEAEPLLVAAYEGLKQDEDAIPWEAWDDDDCMTEAIRRLVELAAATNKPGDVKKWQAELANHPGEKRIAMPDKELLGAKIEIAGKMVNGAAIDWAAYRGKIVLVGFWTTRSPESRLEIANVKKLLQLYHNRGFDVVGVSLDVEKRDLQRNMEQERLPWATLYTRGAEGNDPLALRCGIVGVPASLLFDREGKVISTSARGDDLASLLEKLLGPPYGPKGALSFVDLGPGATPFGALPDFRELPKGRQSFLGVEFQIGEHQIMLRGTGEDLPLPERILIPIDQTVGTLYILHAATHCNVGEGVPRGETIGHYQIAYEDVGGQSIPIVCGEDVRDWWAHPGDERPVTRGLVACRWPSPRGGESARLYLSAWKNPHPERKITSIEYTSTNSRAAPFCLAMTIEKPTVEAKGGPPGNSHAAPASPVKSRSAQRAETETHELSLKNTERAK